MDISEIFCKGAPITVTLGQTFTISLKSTPSTGFTWKTEYDSTMIELVKPPKFISNSTAIGGGGEEKFEFKPKRIGEIQIKMKYQREWETTPREIKLYTVLVTQ